MYVGAAQINALKRYSVNRGMGQVPMPYGAPAGKPPPVTQHLFKRQPLVRAPSGGMMVRPGAGVRVVTHTGQVYRPIKAMPTRTVKRAAQIRAAIKAAPKKKTRISFYDIARTKVGLKKGYVRPAVLARPGSIPTGGPSADQPLETEAPRSMVLLTDKSILEFKKMPQITANGQAVPIANRGHAARVQFLDWMKRTNPELYRKVMSKATGETGMSAYMDNGLGQDTKPSLWERITSSISEIGTAYVGYQAQSEMMDINLERARQGLPPLDAASMAPVVRTQVEITPEIAASLKDAGMAGLQRVLLFGGLALAAVFLFMKK